MIPTHVLSELGKNDRIAILSRGGEIHFHVHPVSDDPETVRMYAEREGSQVLKTHLRNGIELQAFVASRERDVGGEG